MTEEKLQEAVVRLAVELGWRWHHQRISVRSPAGWPDLVLCRPPRLLVVELKSTKGVVSRAQQDWLAALAGCDGVEIAVWRPEQWQDGTIERALR